MATFIGNVKACKKAIADAAVSQFKSGWAWLVLDGETLEEEKTSNAYALLKARMKSLLTIDEWECNYHLYYQNHRADYVDAVIERLINWEFTMRNAGK